MLLKKRFAGVFALLLTIVIQGVFAQEAGSPGKKGNKYMLCVGINNYLASSSPSCQVCKDRGLKDLSGCLNDVDTISRLFTRFYDFKNENIVKLLDQDASHAAIMQALEQLLAKSKKGDYMVFFYSGHGSYEYETAADQVSTGKGYRNTIIPADITKPGIRDITSVELNKVFAGFAEKGVVLTVITDCCYSGTNTRGSTLFEVDSSREVKPSPDIRPAAAGVVTVTKKLDAMGAVSIGACQDNQVSSETKVSANVFYGAFTMCLCRAVTEWSQAPVEILLERTIAKLRLLNKNQTPNMEAARRLTMNLPGTAPGQIRKSSYSLKCTNCSKNGLPVIVAGFTDDLYNDDILIDTKTKDSLSVSNVGLSETEVKLINKEGKFKTGDLTGLHFSLLKKLTNPDPPLKIFLGNSVAQEELDSILQKAVAITTQKNGRNKWINPSQEKLPDAVLFYGKNSEGTGAWKLNRDKVKEMAKLQELVPAEINPLLDAAQTKNAYLQLPPAAGFTEQLSARLSTPKNRNIAIVNNPSGADYILAGHLLDNKTIAYGWEKTMLNDKNQDLPVVTDFFPLTAAGTFPVDSLTERVNRLSVLANWLSMKSPPPDNTLRYPYHLAVRNRSSNVKADDKMPGKSGVQDILDILIEKDAGTTLKKDSIPSMFIYVMSMDNKGNTYLFYPQPKTSILTYPNSILYDTSSYRLASVRHTTPGKYHYFFLALREPVSNLNIFTRRGVVKGAQPEFNDNPLEALLNEEGTEQRGSIKSFDHWLLKTVDIVTTDKP
jgi:hypothetical protein